MVEARADIQKAQTTGVIGETREIGGVGKTEEAKKTEQVAKGRKGSRGARQGLGRTGELLAAEKLISCGYQILERNFRCRYGEIDLVAEDGQDLVFVEVKTRRGDAYGRPEEAVTPRKQRKILEVASYYLSLHECFERSWRVDVVAVQLSVSGKLEEIRIYQHALTG